MTWHRFAYIALFALAAIDLLTVAAAVIQAQWLVAVWLVAKVAAFAGAALTVDSWLGVFARQILQDEERRKAKRIPDGGR